MMSRWIARGSGRVAFFVASALVACSDEGSGLRKVDPRLVIASTTIDFGDVPTGATKRLVWTVSNQGEAELHLTASELTAPFLGSATATVPPGREVPIDLGFRPTQVGPASTTLRLTSNDPTQPEASVQLIGKGVVGLVSAFPSRIDFSGTPLFGAQLAQVAYFNAGMAESAGRLVAEFPREFVTIDGMPRIHEQSEDLHLQPLRGATVVMRYRPIEVGLDDGILRYELCGDRCGLEVEVLASAVAPALEIDPPFLDFGKQGIGDSVTRQVEIVNPGTNSLRVETVSLTNAELSYALGPTLPTAIDPEGRLALQITWRPTSRVRLDAELVVASDAPGLTREAHVRIVGESEGPLLVVQPSSLDFGAQRDEGPHRRVLTILNAGSGDMEIRGINISGDREFTTGQVGLPAFVRGGESMFVDLFYSPSVVGTHTATVTVETSAGVGSVVLLGGRAEAVCELRFSPSTLQFGAVELTTTKEMAVEIHNDGSDLCRIVSGRFSAPVEPAITLTSSSSFPIELPANGDATLSFSFLPTRERDYKSQYIFTTDDVVLPNHVLPLFGSGAVPRVCGNGNLDPGEECDDGNIIDNDGCQGDCSRLGRCGNAAVDAGEDCDDGNLVSRDGCSALCRLETCGDGRRDPDEECDDGNLSNGDGCSSACLKDQFRGDIVTVGLGGIRTVGSGSLSLRGVSGSVRSALLYWNGPTSVADAQANATIEFAGVSVEGKNVGFASSNCWPFSNGQSYRADVTQLVTGDGDYTVDNLIKGPFIEINGVSLIVVYDDGNSSNDVGIWMIDANDSNIASAFEPAGWLQSVGPVSRPTAADRVWLEIHASDGQSYMDGDLAANQTVIAPMGAIFDGNTTPVASVNAASATWGALWDIRRFEISSAVPVGSSTVEITASTLTNDCVSLVVGIVLVD
ncbi:MAG: choice-of-anchor D domain-containing protein [Deltaproteobacteria bacterium]|nr:choice-of-anchor D domain-containing protein [Deltaproteobacteria bacterium]